MNLVFFEIRDQNLTPNFWARISKNKLNNINLYCFVFIKSFVFIIFG